MEDRVVSPIKTNPSFCMRVYQKGKPSDFKRVDIYLVDITKGIESLKTLIENMLYIHQVYKIIIVNDSKLQLNDKASGIDKADFNGEIILVKNYTNRSMRIVYDTITEEAIECIDKQHSTNLIDTGYPDNLLFGKLFTQRHSLYVMRYNNGSYKGITSDKDLMDFYGYCEDL